MLTQHMTPLLVQAAATLFMTGLIWFVQVVHYPLAAEVGSDSFAAYQSAHMRLTGFVVGPPMLVELAATAWLLTSRPDGVPTAAAWIGAALLAVVWTSTALLQVPAHRALLDGLDQTRVQQLVAGNWVRTAAWTVRAVLALLMIAWAVR